MPIDFQSGSIVIRTRDQVRDQALKDYVFRVPDADVGPNSQPYVDATIIANVVAPIYANAKRLGQATTWLTATGDELTKWAAGLGRPRKPATGGIGYVIIEAASGGGSILAGAELRHIARGLRYQVITGGVYLPGDLCAVQGIDTGSSTNLDAGSELKWLSPAPGILGTCKVFANSDGSGITGGGAEETDEELVDALIDIHANPATSGNEAAILEALNRMQGIAIQRGFVFPCIEGPGEYAVAFTMRPSKLGGSRIPNGAHLAAVDAYLQATFPGDDGIFVASVASHAVKPCLRVKWDSTVDGFVDTTPWPPYAATKVIVEASPTPTANSARLKFCAVAPSVGATIAFFDAATNTFKRKRIATVSSVIAPDDKYDVTFDLAGNASDPAYVPLAGAIVSPYATNMSALAKPLLEYVDAQGVGEMVSVFGDPGKRQRRAPTSKPGSWPHVITNAILDDVFELVEDATLVEPTTPFATTTGTAPLLVYLHSVTDIGIFVK